MASKILLRRDTAANWTLSNPILTDGEMGIETDTRKHKIGDGSTTWNMLKYGAYSREEIDQIILNLEMVQPLPAGDIAPLIYKPIITYPLEGATDYIGTIEASEFQTISTYKGEHDYSEWQIAYNALFTDMIGSYQGGVSLESWNPSSVPPLTTVYVRVRYGSDGHLSDWSDALSFTTPVFNLEIPIITAPANLSTDVVQAPILSFETTNAIDGHISTRYQIATDIAFTDIVYDVTSETDLLSHVVANALNQGVAHYFRVMYTTVAYGGSAWSTPRQFNTAAFTEMVYFAEVFPGLDEIGRSIIVDKEGYYHTLGEFFKIDSSSQVNSTAVITKMDNKFHVINSPFPHRKTFRNNVNQNTDYKLMKIDSDGNYVVACEYTTSAVYGIRLFKADQNFNVIVSNTINVVATTAKDVRVQDLIEDSNGNYVIVGTNLTDKTFFIMVLDKDFNHINNRKIAKGTVVSPYNIIENSEGDYVFVGYRDTGGYGGKEGNILKFDKNLNLLSNKVFSTSENPDALEWIECDENDNYYAVGFISSTTSVEPRRPWIVKLDSNFNVLASKAIGPFGDSTLYRAVKINSVNEIVAVGQMSSLGLGDGDIIVSKFDANLNMIDSILIGGTGSESVPGDGVSIDNDDNIVIYGSSKTAKTNSSYYGVFGVNIKGDFSAIDGTITETLGYQITKPVLDVENIAVGVFDINETSLYQEPASGGAMPFEYPALTFIEKTALY